MVIQPDFFARFQVTNVSRVSLVTHKLRSMKCEGNRQVWVKEVFDFLAR